MTLHDCAVGKATDKCDIRKCGMSLAQLYEPYVAQMRARQNGLVCELGISGGGSLRMWSEYFCWRVLGVDVQEHCKQYRDESIGIDVICASQDDPIVRDEIASRGGADIIIDDASHLTTLMVSSFELLWPCVKRGGMYIIEDTLMTYIADIASEVSRGGWGGMDKCKCELKNNRKDIDRLIAHLAHSVDTSDIQMAVSSIHILPHAIIIKKAE